MDTPRPIKRALLSVSDKTGIVEFAQKLAQKGVDILSTGGTAKLLAENGIKVCRDNRLIPFQEAYPNPSYSIHPGKSVQVYFGRYSIYTLYKYWYNALK